jgi:thiamine kinase-like enzyme
MKTMHTLYFCDNCKKELPTSKNFLTISSEKVVSGTEERWRIPGIGRSWKSFCHCDTGSSRAAETEERWRIPGIGRSWKSFCHCDTGSSRAAETTT